jgi:hypothetical protein
MSDKFDGFTIALDALCREHGCQITSNDGEISVWPLNTGDGTVWGWLEDRTDSDAQEAQLQRWRQASRQA